ncbi:unnamed protein product [Rotaria sp. Silwood2]|nr:unnamed protein product [Rotaria sp. Silwood2]
MIHNNQVNWIGSTQIYMHELRKEFNVSNTSPIRSATVFISGIGYYEMYLNADNIDLSRKLDPGWTTYQKRTFFVSYDVTSKIKVGMNAVGVKLGNGPSRLMFVLHVIFEDTDQMNVYSDQTWKGRQGSIIHDSVYNGEIVDARYDHVNWAQVGFNDSLSLWITPEILSSPVNIATNGQLTLQDMPLIRAGLDALRFEVEHGVDEKKSYLSKEEIGNIFGASLKDGRVLKPISVSTPFFNVHTFDMEQNMVGWCRFKFRGPRGVSIYIRHAAVLSQPVVSTGYDNGHHDLAMELITSINYPSYGFMFNTPYENPTTLWELWNAPFGDLSMDSRHHHMFASVGAWFYSHLAGIDLQSELIVIRPRMVSEEKEHLLSKIDSQLSTLYGLVDVSYTHDERDTFANFILLRITIPTNAEAKVVFEPLFPGAKCVTATEDDAGCILKKSVKEVHEYVSLSEDDETEKENYDSNINKVAIDTSGSHCLFSIAFF